jgi:predicted nucleic acid-binding protein
MGTTSETHKGTVTLIDTCLLIRALEREDAAANVAISQAQHEGGAVANVVILAEICAGSGAPEEVSAAVRSLGVQIVEMPEAVPPICGRAFSLYLDRRSRQTPARASKTPLPDFFIGAHAQVMGWQIATSDTDRFKTYFPEVNLICVAG